MKDDKQFKTILLKSRELFMKHGLKSLTMDDIARELGMSKKTIYRFVENKADLIKFTLRDHLDEDRAILNGILKNSINSIDEMLKLIEYFLQVVQDFNSTTLYDMQKYYPESWELYNEYRFNFMLDLIKENLKTGVQQGYYRKELNTDVIARIYVLAVEILGNQELFPARQYNFQNVYSEYLNYHLRGIVTEKGLKYIEDQNLFRN